MALRKALVLIEGRPSVLPSGDTLEGSGGGGGSSPTFGVAEIAFGAHPGTNEGSVAIIGQASILTGSVPQAWFAADDTTTDRTANDHRYVPLFVKLTCGAPSEGVGFTIHARSAEKMTGTFKVRWSWQ